VKYLQAQVLKAQAHQVVQVLLVHRVQALRVQARLHRVLRVLHQVLKAQVRQALRVQAQVAQVLRVRQVAQVHLNLQAHRAVRQVLNVVF